MKRHHQLVKLPPSCSLCRPFGGLWRRGLRGGLERCDCPRGLAILASAPKRKRKPRVLAYDGRKAATGDQD